MTGDCHLGHDDLGDDLFLDHDDHDDDGHCLFYVLHIPPRCHQHCQVIVNLGRMIIIMIMVMILEMLLILAMMLIIMMDVVCSTSPMFHLVAISIDRCGSSASWSSSIITILHLFAISNDK